MRLLFSSPLAAASLLAVACAGTPAVSPEPTPSTSAPTFTPTTVPSPSAVPHLSSRLLAGQPVLEGAELGEEPEQYEFTLSAAYFTEGDTHHLYVVGFGQSPGDQQPFHATSVDGITWTVDAGDPLASFESQFNPPGPVPGTVMPGADGGWVMYLWGVSPSAGISQIYHATADDPGGPWTMDEEPVVPFGEADEMDNLGLDFPAVVSGDDGYVMLYGANGGDMPHNARILLATSDDGIHWEKQGRVIEPELCGGTDLDYPSNPRLFIEGDGYLATALMGDQVYALRSEDAVTWTCQADDPAFAISLIEGSDRVHTYAAAQARDEVNLMIEALFTQADGSSISNLWLAQLTDQ
jgi:hypothetical protein